MRVQFAVIFSLICTSAMADSASESGMQPSDATAPVPISSHQCDVIVPSAKKALKPGTTRVSFRINADGNVQDVHVEQPSGIDWIDREGALCASHWRYKPATRGR